MRPTSKPLASLLLKWVPMLSSNRMTAVTLLVSSLTVAQDARSQSTLNDVLGNGISINVRGGSSFNQNTGLYTYTYTVLNSSNSVENVRYFALRLGGLVMPDVLAPSSPFGWSYHLINGRPIIRWGANSTSQITPGQQLGGFRFQSHVPPGNITYYAKGWVVGPQAAPGDLDDEHAQNIPDFTQIGVNGTTVGPVSTVTQGPPSVRGFVVVLNPQQGSISSPPIQVQLKFAIDGESVDRSTFHAQLNGLDVTNTFGAGSGGVDLQANFNLRASPLQTGNNDFVASVTGTDPQSGGSVVGLSRITFTVAKTMPGDVNGDGKVDCTDIAIVKASFGKKTGQPGFDPRADVNLDGVVDIRDLAYVSQHLPAGTSCP
jgi:Dockerin type I domain